MKKVVQINSVVNSGSTGRIAEDIGQLMMSKKWDSYIIFGRYGNSSKSKVTKIGNNLGVINHFINTRIFDKHGLSSNLATSNLINILKKIKPDIIHLHNIHGYYVNYVMLFEYFKTINTPIFWTLHDCWAFTGHCVYFDFVGCEKWQTNCNHCPILREYPTSLIFDNSKRNFLIKKKTFNSIDNLTLIPVSNWLSDLVDKSFLSNISKKIIHNGIDLEVFKPSFNNNSINFVNKFIILGVANIWNTRKGHHDFIKLSSMLDTNIFQIIMVGLTKKQIKNLPKEIKGYLKTESLEQLANFYSIADVFLNPTYEDNFPTTNLEALACGTPIITYNTGGSPEAIDEKTGYIVDKGDLFTIIDKIELIKSNSKQYYSKFCRKRAEDYFNKDDKYNELYNLYNEVLK